MGELLLNIWEMQHQVLMLSNGLNHWILVLRLHLHMKVIRLMLHLDLMEKMEILIQQFTRSKIFFLRVKTLGGIQNEESAINTTMSLKDINIDLQSWRKSLNDSKIITVIDLTQEGYSQCLISY